MANYQRAEVEIEVSGTTYTLSMVLNALCELQAVLKPDDPASVDLDDVMARVVRMNPTYVRAFCWAMFRRHHKHLTLEQVSDVVAEAGGIQAFSERASIRELIGHANPDPVDRGAVKGAARGARPLNGPVDGTGTSSSSRRVKSA